MRPTLVPGATAATLVLLLAATLTGGEQPDESPRADSLSIQPAAPDLQVPASCQFDEMDGRGRSRLKLLDRTAYELAREGCRGSATFRGLVRRIEELRGFVFVTSTVTLPATTEGVLLHRIQLTPDGSRCLWIVVKLDRLSVYRVGVLGHELQHALEVLEHPDVRSSDDIERLFRRQRPATDGQILETDAALAAGDRVVSELAKGRRRPSLDRVKPAPPFRALQRDGYDRSATLREVVEHLATSGWLVFVRASVWRTAVSTSSLAPMLADLGRLLWFDTVTGLNNDNNCSGCHSPANGFGDSQSIAIGVENNGIVGPNRAGPRNQRRTPMIVNSAFFPNLMWNSRLASLSNDPFDNSAGFLFPPPEGLTLSYLPHLLHVQAFIPPTERVEVAGFGFPGDNVDIRNEVLRRINDVAKYRNKFGKLFPSVRNGGPIDFDMLALAIAEFEFALTLADAPIDRFARGQKNALTDEQKRGALLFFGEARCVQCHKVSGPSNEMFSDFSPHVIGVPQIAPLSVNGLRRGSGRKGSRHSDVRADWRHKARLDRRFQ